MPRATAHPFEGIVCIPVSNPATIMDPQVNRLVHNPLPCVFPLVVSVGWLMVMWMTSLANAFQVPSGDNFASSRPVMTFQAPNGQVYVPKTITETRTVNEVRYTPVYSYQPQLKNVYGWNPLAQPQQIWEQVPIVQYQPSYVPVTQPVTYQKFEKQDVTKMVPVLTTKSEQKPKYVDKPLTSMPNGPGMPPNGAMLTSFPINHAQPNINGQPNGDFNPNVIQQAAVLAQSNRNFHPALRPMDQPRPGFYGYNTPNYVATAPQAYYPQAANPYVPNPSSVPMTASVPTAANPQTNVAMIPMVPILPMANNYAYPQPPPTYTATRPLIQLPAFLNRSGSLFGSSVFANNRNAIPNYAGPNYGTYMASNTNVNQPYVWGGNNGFSNTGYGSSGGSGFGGSNPSTSGPSGFRPNTSPYASQPAFNGQPQPTWNATGIGYRDPLQGGMQATELR
jgi:hypothetical protein